MKLIATKNITLENVKKSNYWELIALVVWNHYREKKYQDESKVQIIEQWYGKSNGCSSHSDQWNNPNYSENKFVRTLDKIKIIFTRSDYTTFIGIDVETGNVSYYAIFNDKNNDRTPNLYPQSIDLMNWMLEHDFIQLN